MLRQFSIFIPLLLVSAAWADDLPDLKKHSFPTAGISLHIPAGSSLASTLPAGVLFDFWSADKTIGFNAAITQVSNPSADQYASQLALQLRGIKEEWDEKIDGEPAFRISLPVKLDKVTSRTSIVTVQDNRALVITAFGTDSAKSEEAARRLSRTASFTAPEPPAEHVAFSDKTGFAFGEPSARVIISAPEWLRVGKSAGRQLTLSGYDFAAGKEAFTAAFNYTDVPEQMHAAEFAARMVPQLKSRFGGKDAEMWSAVPDKARFYMTPMLRPLQPSPGAPALYKMALIEVAPGRILQIAFMIHSDVAAEQKAYTDLAGEMIQCIKVANAPIAMPAPAGPPVPVQAGASEK
jgi:hypothetical protein